MQSYVTMIKNGIERRVPEDKIAAREAEGFAVYKPQSKQSEQAAPASRQPGRAAVNREPGED